MLKSDPVPEASNFSPGNGDCGFYRNVDLLRQNDTMAKPKDHNFEIKNYI
jgi:hypothetical protein